MSWHSHARVYMTLMAPSPGLERELDARAKRVTASGLPIKVAVIASRSDLGAVPQLWGKPQGVRAVPGIGVALRDARHPAGSHAARLRRARALPARAGRGSACRASHVDARDRGHAHRGCRAGVAALAAADRQARVEERRARRSDSPSPASPRRLPWRRGWRSAEPGVGLRLRTRRRRSRRAAEHLHSAAADSRRA